jgi:DNA polymerase-3 subunit delta'
MARSPKTAVSPAPPDRLPGIALPRENLRLFGHAAAERILLDAYRSGRMHHAWLITGPDGIGKATLAFRIARFILANPDPAHQIVDTAVHLDVDAPEGLIGKIARGIHPNILHLQRPWDERAKRYKTEISVDTVRRIVPFLGTTAGEGGWRIVIVDPADELNRSAANALLKGLEEPPPRTLFVLVSRTPGRLLTTIRSRCRTLPLRPLGEEELNVALAHLNPEFSRGDQVRDRVLIRLADGSPRRALELVRQNAEALYGELTNALATCDLLAFHSLADTCADPRGETLGQLLELYAGYLHRRVKGEAEPDNSHKPPLVPLVTWAQLWEKAARSASDVDTYNLDRKAFVLDLLERHAAAVSPGPAGRPATAAV